jgi:hypothetical protein
LFGENYDSRRSWLSNSTWDNEFPNVIFYNNRRKMKRSNQMDDNVREIPVNEDDDEDEDYNHDTAIDTKQVWWKKAWPKGEFNQNPSLAVSYLFLSKHSHLE